LCGTKAKKLLESSILGMRESDLYKPVAQFFERRYAIPRKNIWSAGSGTDLSFLAGFGRRKPDVVACNTHLLRREVHLAEAKLHNIRTHGFDETVNQLDSFRPYADFLWAVFPLTKWASAPTNHDRWIAQLQEKRYGLLLVDGGRAKRQLDAQQNFTVDALLKKSVLTELLGDPDDPISIPTLSTETAEIANLAAARVAAIMIGPVREIFGKDRRQTPFIIPDFSDAQRYFLIGSVESGQVVIEGDPFSSYLNDGRALVWVWRECGTLRQDEESIQAITSRRHPSDVHFFADNGNWKWVCRPIAELSVENLKAEGYVEQFRLGRVIGVSGRSSKGIRKDLSELIAWARGR
jgi:hypothetical protein